MLQVFLREEIQNNRITKGHPLRVAFFSFLSYFNVRNYSLKIENGGKYD